MKAVVVLYSIIHNLQPNINSIFFLTERICLIECENMNIIRVYAVDVRPDRQL